jgi:5-methyltetrahydrofolate corrinoid/iron sulfur protein methyltransferase
MILIAESLNIMSATLGPALRGRDAKPIQEMAIAEDKAGADYLDLNIGPARKGGDELMKWVVSTVQEVTKKPLSLDTTNPVAMEAGLSVCNNKTLMNSISLQPARLDVELPMVNKYNTEMIGLLWGVEGMPRDANERCMLAVDIVFKANEKGIPNEKIWIDPIATPVSGEINQVRACFEFLGMLQDICPGCKTTVGLSNISNGTPAELRPWLNRTFLIMLEKLGLYSAIADVFDTELVKIAHGERPDIVKLVRGMMDGEKPDMASLSDELKKYAKTVRVIKGENLYSHSWLEV